MDIIYESASRSWTLQMESSTYCLGLSRDASSLQHIYWGPSISLVDAKAMADATEPLMIPFESAKGVFTEEYTPWGGIRFGEPGLKVEFGDGTRVIEWTFEEAGIERSEEYQTLWLRFHDLVYPLAVTLYYRIYAGLDVIERWARLDNTGGNGAVIIEQAFSADWQLPRRENYRLTYLHGRWGKETQLAQNIVGPAKMVLESRRGATSHEFNPWIALDPDAKATEEYGEVWSMALAWSGSWKFVIETTSYGTVHCVGGINDWDFRYHLSEKPHQTHPTHVGVYSSAGFGEISRQWHTYELERVLPAIPQDVRPVLYNSWEATAFAVNELNQVALAEKAASIGTEVFVVDDGWFGARDNDYAGLGDWTVNQEKFPQGLNPLIARVNALGMRFGLWVEPEMVNADSDLYRSHPDWVYHFRNRSRSEGRNQLVLNLAREDVRKWMFNTLDQLLSSHNIEFIKWDMNRSISEPGWPDEVGHNPERVWLDHVRNLYWVIDTLRQKHPKVAFESCSGGGGRIDLGILSRVEQVWTSDNTDAFDRLRIQEGFTYAYAPRAMMCWVTDCPNFVTRRTVSLKFRFHVAMAGSLGIGGDLSHWAPQELEEARDLIAAYKRVRSTIQNGLLYRLRSPRAGNIVATQYLARTGDEVVVFAWGHSQQFGETKVSLQLQNLEEKAQYTDVLNNISYSGAFLAQKGLPINLMGDFDSCMIHLTRNTTAR